MQSHTWRALGALATAVLCALASAASASAKPNACDVNGTWFGTFASSSGGTTLGSVELEITQHGKKFTWIAHAAGLPMVEVAAGKGKIGKPHTNAAGLEVAKGSINGRGVPPSTLQTVHAAGGVLCPNGMGLTTMNWMYDVTYTDGTHDHGMAVLQNEEGGGL